jgi:hypothetical protein
MYKRISLNKIIYLAGFLDGDGSIYVRAKPNRTYRYGFQIAPCVALYQSAKNRLLFQEVCSMIGYGSMRERKDGIMEYTITKNDNILSFLKEIKSFAVLKRKQIDLMIRILEKKKNIKNQYDFQRLLDLIGEFGNINYSKKCKQRRLTP